MKRRKLEFKDFFNLNGEELKDFCKVLLEEIPAVVKDQEKFLEEIKKKQKLRKEILYDGPEMKYSSEAMKIKLLIMIYNNTISSPSSVTAGRGVGSIDKPAKTNNTWRKRN